MQLSEHQLRERWMVICHRHEEAAGARAARANVCYSGILRHVRGVEPTKRDAMVQEFFELFPNGDQLAKAANLALRLDFEHPAPLEQVVGFVNRHLGELGLGTAVAEEVSWTAERGRLSAAWVDKYRAYREAESLLPGAVGRILRDLVEAAFVGTVRTPVGTAALHEPRYMVLRLLWDLADDVATPWDQLASVVLRGWMPLGLSDEGTFLVARLPERAPELL